MIGQADSQDIYGQLRQLRAEIQLLREHLISREPGTPPSIRTDHPHIIRMEGLHGGRPIIRGSGVSVQTVVEQTRLGHSPQEIVALFAEVVTLAQVHDALSYYYEHEQEVEQYIAENREALWKGPQAPPRP